MKFNFPLGARKDLKWIFGIAFTVVLMAFLFVYSVKQSITPQNTRKVVNVFVEGFLGDLVTKNYGELQSWAQNNPDQTFQVPEFPFQINLTGRQIQVMSQEQVKSEFSQQITDQAIEKGLPKQFQEGFGGIINSMLVLSRPQTTQNLERIYTILLITLIVSGIPYLIFSIGFGKITSLGTSLVIASAPGFFFFTLFTSKLKEAKDIPKIALEMNSIFLRNYSLFFKTGIVLLIVGDLLVIGFKILKKRESSFV